jgi:hypothetical protein
VAPPEAAETEEMQEMGKPAAEALDLVEQAALAEARRASGTLLPRKLQQRDLMEILETMGLSAANCSAESPHSGGSVALGATRAAGGIEWVT